MATGISPMEMAEIDAAILAQNAISLGANPEDVRGLLKGGGQVATVPTQQPQSLSGILGDMWNSRPPINSVSDVFNPAGLTGLLPEANTMRGLQQETPPSGSTLEVLREGMSPIVDTLVPSVRVGGETVFDSNAKDAAVAASTLKSKEATPTTDDVHTVVDATITDAKKKGVDPATFTPQKPDNVEQGYWDKLTSQFDLTTVGISLLATNGNGKPLAANLGLALAAGKDAITKEASSREAAKDTKLNRAKKIAEIKKLAAETAKEMAEATGVNPKDITATQLGIEQSFLQTLTGSKAPKDIPADLAKLSWQYRKDLARLGKSNKAEQDKLLHARLLNEGYLDEGFWGGVDAVPASTRVGR